MDMEKPLEDGFLSQLVLVKYENVLRETK